MSLRDSMNNNSALVTLAAVVLLVVALGWIILKSKGPSGASQFKSQYYYDLNTGTIFAADSSEMPPIETPSGPDKTGNPAGVRARVFACGDCRRSYVGMTEAQMEEAGAFIAFIEKFTPEFKKAVEEPKEAVAEPTEATGVPGDPNYRRPGGGGRMMMEGGQGLLIRQVNGEKWLSMRSREAQKITTTFGTKCPDGRSTPCYPK